MTAPAMTNEDCDLWTAQDNLTLFKKYQQSGTTDCLLCWIGEEWHTVSAVEGGPLDETDDGCVHRWSILGDFDAVADSYFDTEHAGLIEPLEDLSAPGNVVVLVEPENLGEQLAVHRYERVYVDTGTRETSGGRLDHDRRPGDAP
jgi:hypothetical protein